MTSILSGWKLCAAAVFIFTSSTAAGCDSSDKSSATPPKDPTLVDGGGPSTTTTNGEAGIAGLERASLVVDGRRYEYLVRAAAVPPSARRIIIAFHGLTGSGAAMAALSKIHEHANAADAIVAYPSGWFTTWDGRPDSIDVHMTSELIRVLRSAHGSDLPVCVVGISAGGTMAWRVAAEIAEVRALVAVAGPLNPVSGAPPHASLRVLHLHGDADTLVPLDGGAGPFGNIPPAQAGIDLFRDAGVTAELRIIPGGTHEWQFGKNYDTTSEVVSACTRGE